MTFDGQDKTLFVNGGAAFTFITSLSKLNRLSKL